MTVKSHKKDEYRFVGRHIDDLADGRTLEPGGFYHLNADQAALPHNKQRIDAGLLIPTNPKERD